MSTQVRTWTEYCGAEGEPSRWDLSINDRPVPGGYIEKTAEGFEIHYPHLPLKKLTTLEEAKRSLDQQIAHLIARYGARILPLHCGEMDVSSADLRRMAMEGKNISSYVPGEVGDYIRRNRLYQGAVVSIN